MIAVAPSAVPVQRRTTGGIAGSVARGRYGRGGGPIDFDSVRSTADGYRLLIAAIFAVPSGAAIEEDDDGRRR